MKRILVLLFVLMGFCAFGPGFAVQTSMAVSDQPATLATSSLLSRIGTGTRPQASSNDDSACKEACENSRGLCKNYCEGDNVACQKACDQKEDCIYSCGKTYSKCIEGCLPAYKKCINACH
jgi:hypothetical protein